MWLPETAVDLETLDIMAELGIRFTVLSTHQAREVRDLDQDSWTDVSGRRIDPTMAYELNLPSGRKISLFFYDGPISQAVSFEHLLASGEHLLQRLMGAFSEESPRPQLVHIATDGETYGHHQQYGDMALAYALEHIESDEQDPAYQLWGIPRKISSDRPRCGYSKIPPGAARTEWTGGGETAAATAAAIPDGTRRGALR